jgi:deoxyadenosine/deoxycytidine kinase
MSALLPKTHWFIVEGNIGSGKSTFLRIMNKLLKIPVLFEPLERWQSIDGKYNILQKFYEDMPRWAYTFQSYAFVSRIVAQQEYSKEHAVPYSLAERSVFSDRYCFARNCFEQGTLSELEWQLYKEWFNWLVQESRPQPLGFIYLQTDPSICYQRLLKRKRSEESEVPLTYLQQLHRLHEEWLIEKQNVDSSIVNTPVLVINCDQDFSLNEQRQEEHAKKIQNFISHLIIS